MRPRRTKGGSSHGAFDLDSTILLFKYLRKRLVGGLAVEDFIFIGAVWVLEMSRPVLCEKLLGLRGCVESKFVGNKRQA